MANWSDLNWPVFSSVASWGAESWLTHLTVWPTLTVASLGANWKFFMSISTVSDVVAAPEPEPEVSSFWVAATPEPAGDELRRRRRSRRPPGPVQASSRISSRFIGSVSWVASRGGQHASPTPSSRTRSTRTAAWSDRPPRAGIVARRRGSRGAEAVGEDVVDAVAADAHEARRVDRAERVDVAAQHGGRRARPAPSAPGPTRARSAWARCLAVPLAVDVGDPGAVGQAHGVHDPALGQQAQRAPCGARRSPGATGARGSRWRRRPTTPAARARRSATRRRSGSSQLREVSAVRALAPRRAPERRRPTTAAPPAAARRPSPRRPARAAKASSERAPGGPGPRVRGRGSTSGRA